MEHPVTDVTPTMLTPFVISTLRQADHLANQVNDNKKFVKLHTIFEKKAKIQPF